MCKENLSCRWICTLVSLLPRKTRILFSGGCKDLKCKFHKPISLADDRCQLTCRGRQESSCTCIVKIDSGTINRILGILGELFHYFADVDTFTVTVTFICKPRILQFLVLLR